MTEGGKKNRRKSLLDFLKFSKVKTCSSSSSSTTTNNNKLKSKTLSFDHSSTSDENEDDAEKAAPLTPTVLLDVPDHVHTPPPMRSRGRSLSHCGPIDSLLSTKFDPDVRHRLQRISERSLSNGPNGLLDNDMTCGQDSPNTSAHKQARFQEEVDVFHHDAEGKLAFKNCVQLKPGDARWKWSSEGPDDLVVTKPTHSKKHIFPVEDVEVRWKQNKKYLRLLINLGRKLSDGKISLRALKDGTKLILTVQKMEPLGDGTEFLRQYVDRFVLPQPISSVDIEATPEAHGWLAVEALLL